jgi:c-di-GMP-binding flagellar brake protein YcgR
MMERRNFPRVEASTPVLYFTDSYPSPNVAWTIDLSLGGTRIEPSYGLTPGRRFWITVSIRPQTIKCRAKTVYVLGPENGDMKAGIEFEELSEPNKLSLQQYLSYITEQRA